MGLTASYALRTGGCVLFFFEFAMGEIGEGVLFTLYAERIKIVDAMVRSFEPLVLGADPTMAGNIFARAWADIRTVGQSGFAVNALAGLDMALWDLRAKLAGLNVAGMVGACRATLPV